MFSCKPHRGARRPLALVFATLVLVSVLASPVLGKPGQTSTTSDPWTYRAGGCTGDLGGWKPHSKDQRAVGDFDGDGADELLLTSALTGGRRVLDFDPVSETWVPKTAGTDGQLDTWPLGLGDRLLPGEFDLDQVDELVAISRSRGAEQLLEHAPWTINDWITRSGSTNGRIDLWNLNLGDQFVVGDFDDDQVDELLALSYQSGYKQLIEYDPVQNRWRWRSGVGGGLIGQWPIQAQDRYVGGDFDGDGEDEVLALSWSQGREQLLEYEETQVPNAWVTRSGSSNGQLDLWYLGQADRYAAGDFDGDGADELLAVSWVSAYEHVIDYRDASSDWRWKTGSGDGLLGTWKIDDRDRYLAGDFDGDGVDELLAVSHESGQWQLLEYRRCADLVATPTAHWRFDEGTGSLARDDLGGHDGQVSGARWLSGSTDDFTVVALPDTQYYSARFANGTFADDLFDLQTRWIVDSRNALDTRMVVHLGDIVDHPGNSAQWAVAENAMDRLVQAAVPFVLMPGNHDGGFANTTCADCQQNGNCSDVQAFNASFPASAFPSGASYGHSTQICTDNPANGNQNNYRLFDVDGLGYGVVSLEWNPPAEALSWANTVVADHPDRLWIVVTHGYLDNDGTRLGMGQRVWDDFAKNHPNVVMVLAGHVPGEARERTARGDAPPVMEILSDYQMLPKTWFQLGENLGMGYLRTYTFQPALDRVLAKTYSPYCDGVYSTVTTPTCDPYDVVASYPGSDSVMSGEPSFCFRHPMGGKVGGGLRFDGQGGRVAVPDAAALDVGSGDFSLAFWVRPRDQSTVRSLIDKRQTWGGIVGYHAFLYQGRPAVQLADGTHTNFVAPASMKVPLDDRWHLVSISVERGSRIVLRMDDQRHEIPTGAHTGNLDNTAALLLGGHANSPSVSYWGDLDEVMLFHQSLSDADHQRLLEAASLGVCP